MAAEAPRGLEHTRSPPGAQVWGAQPVRAGSRWAVSQALSPSAPGDRAVIIPSMGWGNRGCGLRAFPHQSLSGMQWLP